MRKIVFILLVALQPFCSNAFSNIFVRNIIVESPQPVDKKTQIRSDLRQAKYMFERQEYTGSKKLLDRVLKLDPSNKEAKSLLEKCQSKIDEQLEMEASAYQSACQKGTIEAYQVFISNYPNGKYHQEAKNKIEDIKLWTEAKTIATKEAYENYLSFSPLRTHLREAESQINILSEEDDWSHCNTKSKADLEKYLSQHPQSKYAERAKYHLNILKANEAYTKGDKLAAFSYLEDAKKVSPLFDDELRMYNTLQDEYQSPRILISNNVDEVSQYLTNLSPSSNYYNRISNHLAVLLSSKFTATSSLADISRAMDYAKDDATRNIVKHNADNATSSKYTKSLNQNTKKEKTDGTSWWKDRLHVGIKADVEKNVYETSWAFDGGVVLKIGKHTDLFNFLVGADFRFYIFDKFPRNVALARVAHKAYITGGQIVVPLTAKFNVLKVSDSWRLYVGGSCNIQSKIHDSFKILKPHSVSFEPQAGFTSRHWDLGAHFKIFGKTPYFINCRSNYIGIQATYYF